MPRAAGDSRDYEIAVVDSKGNAREILGGFPSVTTIIGDADGTSKDAMSGWGFNLGVAGLMELVDAGLVKAGDDLTAVRKRMFKREMAPWQKRDKRAEEGTAVHDVAEQLVLGKISPDDVEGLLDQEQQGYGRSLVKWHAEYAKQGRLTVAVERTCVSLDHQFSGTADLIDQQSDWPANHCRVVDYKTSKEIRESHKIQGTAYGMAWQEQTAKQGNPMQVREISVVRFGEDGTYDEHVEPYKGAEVFLAMRALYRARNGY